MTVHMLDLNTPSLSKGARQRLVWAYYDRVYRAAFPIPDEAEDPTIWLPLMVDQPPLPKPIVHILLAVNDTRNAELIEADAILGGVNFEFFRMSKTALITYLCVGLEARNQGIAKFLIDNANRILHDASPDIPVFAETEEPYSQTTLQAKNTAIRRLSILSHLGFREIPIRYRQPSLGIGKRPLFGLKLLLLNGSQGHSIRLGTVKAFMREFYSAFDETVDENRMFGNLLPLESIITIPL